jgi:hypothetical protein
VETDRLEQMLQDADASAPPPVVESGLVIGVRRRAAQRTMNERIAAVLLISLGVAGILMWSTQRPRTPVVYQLPSPSHDEPADIRTHERFAMELIRLRRESHAAAAARAALLEPDAVQQIDDAREKAALVLLGDANRLARSPSRRDEAPDNYRQVIRLFPHTYGAAQAEQELQEFGRQSGPSSS